MAVNINSNNALIDLRLVKIQFTPVLIQKGNIEKELNPRQRKSPPCQLAQNIQDVFLISKSHIILEVPWVVLLDMGNYVINLSNYKCENVKTIFIEPISFD